MATVEATNTSIAQPALRPLPLGLLALPTRAGLSSYYQTARHASAPTTGHGPPTKSPREHHTCHLLSPSPSSSASRSSVRIFSVKHPLYGDPSVHPHHVIVKGDPERERRTKKSQIGSSEPTRTGTLPRTKVPYPTYKYTAVVPTVPTEYGTYGTS